MSTSPRWGRTTKQLIAATFLVLAGLLVYSFRSVLPLLIIAFLIAYVLAPVVDWASTRLHIRRGLAILLLVHSTLLFGYNNKSRDQFLGLCSLNSGCLDIFPT